MSNYSTDINTKTWARLSLKFSREKDSVFTYKGDTEQDKPHVSSGSGVWVLGETPNAAVWTPGPIMVCIVDNWVRNLGMLIALKLPAFIAAERAQKIKLERTSTREPVMP